MLCSLFVLSSPPAHAQREAATADARLRALYTEEWNWRQQGAGARAAISRGDASDHFPRVDAASQQARLAYWTRTLATLDSIPFDQLSPEEKVNAQVFRTSIRALANDVQVPDLRSAVQQRHVLLDRVHAAPGLRAPSTPYRAYLGRLRDVPRYFDEQIANMRAGLARGFTVPRVSVVGRDKTIEPYVKGDTTNPLYAPFTQMPSTIAASRSGRRCAPKRRR